MAENQSVSNEIEELVGGSSNESLNSTSPITSFDQNANNNELNTQDEKNESQHNPLVQVNANNNAVSQVNTEDHGNSGNVVEIFGVTTNNEPKLLKINEINTDINFVWKIQAVVCFKHPKRTYTNANGLGEVSTWDLMDDSGSINLVAFNLNSELISNKLIEGKSYEINGLSIRTVDVAYRTLPHPFHLIVTNGTNVRTIEVPFKYEPTYNFSHLNEIENLPLNSIIDVDVQVLRDYGITSGNTNNNAWHRRELHVHEDGTSIRMTLWNDQEYIYLRARYIFCSNHIFNNSLINIYHKEKVSFVRNLIKQLCPNAIIAYHLSDLNTHLQESDDDRKRIYISIEKQNKSREYCCLTMEQLLVLYEYCPIPERALYESIPVTGTIKAYIDYEYSINSNLNIQNHSVGPQCFLKVLHYLLNSQENTLSPMQTYDEQIHIEQILEQFLVLEASTTDKISYHFIHAKPSILFENTFTLGIFVKRIVYLLLLSVVEHKCPIFNINYSTQLSNIFSLIDILTPHVMTLRRHCTSCQSIIPFIFMSDIAFLLVQNESGKWHTAIDLNIYSKNQQFRLFNSVKYGKNNPLVLSTIFPFDSQSQYSCSDILQKSLISFIENDNIPKIYLTDNKLTLNLSNSTYSNTKITSNFLNLNLTNTVTDKECLSFRSQNIHTNQNLSRFAYANQNNSLHYSQEQMQIFTTFVEKIITSDLLHQGYIHSCIAGSYNKDILFFNIGGDYRFCPKKNAHHQSNTVAIIIDSKKSTFCIRCKDTDCDNSTLIWKNIQ